jgi:uncharacterized protein YbaA (DUF1428 family)
MAYVRGFIAAVPAANKDAYRKHAAAAAKLFEELGATRIVHGWGDDVPAGRVTDLERAVNVERGEVVVFAWHEYPSRVVAEAANETMTSDPRMKELGRAMPFDGRRVITGGFTSIVDDSSGAKMGYLDGCLVPVPAGNADAYRTLVIRLAAVLREHGATRVVEAWEDDVRDGTVTDHRRAVKAASHEKVVHAWIEWASKEARDQGWKNVIADPRMHPSDIPYDNGRRIHGGFVPLVDV